MENVRAPELEKSGEGQLIALGYLQIGTGSLTVLMSLLAAAPIMMGSSGLFDPVKMFSYASGPIDRLIAGYVLLQLTLGWVAGGLQLAAGNCCQRGKRPRLVGFASLVSLINFPHGTVAAVLMLFALRRPEIAHAFRSRTEA